MASIYQAAESRRHSADDENAHTGEGPAKGKDAMHASIRDIEAYSG